MIRSLSTLSLLLLVLVTGCTFGADPPDPGPALTWRQGEMRGFIDASPARVMSAAALVFERMQLTFVEREGSGDDLRLAVRLEDRRDVLLRAKRIASSRSSRVSVKVGLDGDEDLSRRLLDAILDELSG